MDMGHTIPLSYLPQVGFPHFLMFLEVMLVCACPPGDFDIINCYGYKSSLLWFTYLASKFTLFDFYFFL